MMKNSSWQVRLSYGLSDFACNLIWNMLTLYLMYFYTDIVGLTSIVVGTMLLVTRCVDSITDMLTGVLIDKTHSRWGKSRPYIFFGAFPLAIFSILTFSAPNLSTTGKLIYAYVTYLGVSISYSIVNIPISAILPSLTLDQHERTNLSTARMVCSFLGSTFVSVATLPLIKVFGKHNAKQGFLLTVCLYALIGICFLYITFRNVHEQYTVTTKAIDIKQGFKVLIRNQPWRIFAGSTLFMWASNFFVEGALIYYFTYVIGDPKQASIVAGLISFVPLLGTVGAPFLEHLTFKRNIFIGGSLLCIIGLVVIFVGQKQLLVIYLGASIYAVGQGVRNNMYFAMQADPVDYSWVETGINISGLISAVNSCTGKIAMALAAGMSGFLLQWGHYVPNVRQSHQALLAIQANFIFLPIIMLVISIFIMFFYRLDKIDPQIQRQIKQTEHAH